MTEEEPLELICENYQYTTKHSREATLSDVYLLPFCYQNRTDCVYYRHLYSADGIGLCDHEE